MPIENPADRFFSTNETQDEGRLRAQPGTDQWSMLQTLQHLVLAEQGMRESEAELRTNPVRDQLRPGKLIPVVRDILVRDVSVKVPHPSLEPDGNATLGDLLSLWEQERQEMSDLLETCSELDPSWSKERRRPN